MTTEATMFAGALPELRGRRVTVMGLGQFGGGVGVTKYLVSRGARVTLTDIEPTKKLEKPLAELVCEIVDGQVQCALGGHRLSDFSDTDFVVANPAVPKPWDNKFLQAARAAGVPLLTAMEIVENVVANRVLAKVIAEARTAIREGDSIAGPLKRSQQFPPMVVHMVSIGEKSGELEEMLRNVSESYENQVDTAVQALTSLLEPLMIVFMGVVVGFLVAAILLPMMKLTQAVQAG